MTTHASRMGMEFADSLERCHATSPFQGAVYVLAAFVFVRLVLVAPSCAEAGPRNMRESRERDQ